MQCLRAVNAAVTFCLLVCVETANIHNGTVKKKQKKSTFNIDLEVM